MDHILSGRDPIKQIIRVPDSEIKLCDKVCH
jgi:hypothetical protein